MALFQFSELKKNNDLRSAAVTVLLNTFRILELQATTENFTGSSATYSRIKYMIGDGSCPDMLYATTAIATLAATINGDTTTNTTAAIPLTVQNMDTGATLYTRYFNPLFIHYAIAHPVTSSDSVVMYEEPGKEMMVFRVDEVLTGAGSIQALANA